VHALLIEDLDRVPYAAVEPREPYWLRLKAHVELFLKDAGISDFTVELHQSHVAPLIVDRAKKAAQVVLGSRGHGRVDETFMGSVSQLVARQAPCPVVVVRAAADASSSRIVVGVDGTRNSLGALDFACRRAELTGETVAAVYAWKMGDLPVDKHGNVPGRVSRELEDKRLLLAEAVAAVRAAHPDVTVEQELVPVEPGKALVDASFDASLVVTGSHGRGIVAGMVLGSVSYHVLHKAHCPVAVVR
jgi:nucleotide-binding universal stress UspA family protein